MNNNPLTTKQADSAINIGWWLKSKMYAALYRTSINTKHMNKLKWYVKSRHTLRLWEDATAYSPHHIEQIDYIVRNSGAAIRTWKEIAKDVLSIEPF